MRQDKQRDRDRVLAHQAIRHTGLLLGIGLMGAIDEIVFHQLLQWHHFYTNTTPYWRIFSDGFFHVLTASLLFGGAVRLWLQRHMAGRIANNRPFWAGIVVGAGAFQLFDGTVNHKLLQLHPVRENVDNILPYDIAWNLGALLILMAGWYLWRRSQIA